MSADEDLFRHVVENLDQADALLFGRVTYEMMEQRGDRRRSSRSLRLLLVAILWACPR